MPVDKTGNVNAVDFAAGCALWLQAAVGGAPEASCTPPYLEIRDTATEMHVRTLQLTDSVVPGFAERLGVDYVAVGEADKTGDQIGLTYRVFNKVGAQVGQPITIKGTRDAIVGQLAFVAASLLHEANIVQTASFPSVVESVDDFTIIGKAYLVGAQTLPYDEHKRLDKAAEKSALATILPNSL